MTMEYPAWLDASFVEKILQNEEKDESIKVSSITVGPATVKGDNYSSDMYRVVVNIDGHGSEKGKSLIVKVAPQDGRRKELIESAGFFEAEMSMMTDTLPKMRQILENLCPISLAPRCFYVSHEEPNYLVIEDLVPKGFQMADRQVGLDLDHCLLAIRDLGKFHAASIALKEKDPEALTKYKNRLLRRETSSAMSPRYSSIIKTLSRETAEWPDLSPRITEKLYLLSDALFDKGCDADLYREDDFNVLNHGDFWVNNMLFRYDEHQKPTDIVFVDFQISYHGSPAVDLLYFFGTCPTEEIRLQQRELLLREYHTTLASTMAKLKCNTEVLSFENLEDTLKKRAFSEVFAALIVFPFVALEKDEKIDIGKLSTRGTGYVNPGYRGRSYIKIMSNLLVRYDSMGLLDV